jgi:glycine/D-amino acid oxidase-like deaminating enzyme
MTGTKTVVVVGAGIIGLLTAVRCAQAGVPVTVLDQDDIPSPAAASSDRHRVLRVLHPGDDAAARVAALAHGEWALLEQILGSGIYQRTGALTVIDPGQAAASLAQLAAAGCPARYLEPGELRARYGHIQFPMGKGAILEEHAGVLLSDVIVAAAARWLRGQPLVRLLPRTRVTRIDSQAGAVTTAGATTIGGDRIVIAAGAWSRDLLPGAAGRVLYRQSLLYCQPPKEMLGPWPATPACPALGTEDGAWLIPPVAGTPLKFSAERACRVAGEIDGHDTPRRWRDFLAERCADLLANFRESWITGARDCYYLAAPSAAGSLISGFDNGLTRAYCSSSGSFKYAPLIARSLALPAAGDYYLGRAGPAASDQPAFPVVSGNPGGAR